MGKNLGFVLTLEGMLLGQNSSNEIEVKGLFK